MLILLDLLSSLVSIYIDMNMILLKRIIIVTKMLGKKSKHFKILVLAFHKTVLCVFVKVLDIYSKG